MLYVRFYFVFGVELLIQHGRKNKKCFEYCFQNSFLGFTCNFFFATIGKLLFACFLYQNKSADQTKENKRFYFVAQEKISSASITIKLIDQKNSLITL